MSGPVRSRQVDRSLDDIILEQQQRAGRRGGGRVPSDSRAPAPRSQPYSRAPQEMYPDRPHTQQSNTSTRGPPRGFSQLEPLPPRDDPRAQRRSAQGQEQQFREPERSRGGQRLEEWGRDGGGGQRGGRQQGGRDEGYGDERQDRRAVKAIAIARTQMAESGTQLIFQPAFRHPDGLRPFIAFYIAVQPARRAMAQDNEVTLNSAASSNAKVGVNTRSRGSTPAARHPVTIFGSCSDTLRDVFAACLSPPVATAMRFPLTPPPPQSSKILRPSLVSQPPAQPHALAGAIAGKVRENRKVSITAVGIDAVANMVLAVGNARIYLEENNLDIKVEPRFETQQKNGTDLTVMVFDLISERI
ncbi:MAG: hypothetical protein WDW38_003725 [Sanguina aurantia]